MLVCILSVSIYFLTYNFKESFLRKIIHLCLNLFLITCSLFTNFTLHAMCFIFKSYKMNKIISVKRRYVLLFDAVNESKNIYKKDIFKQASYFSKLQKVHTFFYFFLNKRYFCTSTTIAGKDKLH